MLNTSRASLELPRFAWVVIGAVLVALVSVVDYVTSDELSFSIFYLLPVSLTKWCCGARTGLLFAGVSAGCWLFIDLSAGPTHSHPAIPFWNMSVRLGFFVIVLLALSRLKAAYEREKLLSSVDPLTGALNTRVFAERARAEIDRSTRYGHPFTVAYIDVDDFKAVNDRLGHSTGDAVLCLVAELSRQHARASDAVARLGGDEFALLLPETGAEPSRAALAKISSVINAAFEERGWPVSLSIGAVTFERSPSSVDQMLRLADAAMYGVKRSGKKRVDHVVYSGPDDDSHEALPTAATPTDT